MYVEKIEIPAFRVLRDVVLEFGGVYDPQIFPLGSENGGGKSTLLQLVFALLHCSAEPARLSYLANLLASDSYAGDDAQRLIARITVKIGDEIKTLEFLSLDDEFLTQKLDEPLQYGFATWRKEQNVRRKLDIAEARAGERRTKQLSQEIADLSAELALLNAASSRLYAFLEAQNYDPITSYACARPDGDYMRELVCHVSGQSIDQIDELLEELSSNVFLLGPSNQQYLFLGRATRKALLSAAAHRELARAQKKAGETPTRPQLEYVKHLTEAESVMPGFYAYDWLSVDPLVRLFASARDEDFKSVVTTGKYGDRYSNLLTEVNSLLLGKTVRPLPDLSGVEFLIKDANGIETPLSPEDLSQGELKRLMIYAWLRTNSATSALVLIDEIEASFHPDWQVGIVRDLQEWAPNNQYILATHSYELCQALTPRHVRHLEPRLQRDG